MDRENAGMKEDAKSLKIPLVLSDDSTITHETGERTVRLAALPLAAVLALAVCEREERSYRGEPPTQKVPQQVAISSLSPGPFPPVRQTVEKARNTRTKPTTLTTASGSMPGQLQRMPFERCISRSAIASRTPQSLTANTTDARQRGLQADSRV